VHATAPAPPAPDAPRSSALNAPQPTLSWEKVVERVEQQHPNIGAFLAKAIYIGIENGHVTIGYPSTASVALARLQKEEALHAVGSICSQFVGQPIQLRVIEVNDGQHPGPSVAELRAQKERAQKHQLLEQSRSHPLVKQTLAIFGGDVIEVRQTAPQEETGHV
jgi:DNA polymerase-3 subunit gamma/tau